MTKKPTRINPLKLYWHAHRLFATSPDFATVPLLLFLSTRFFVCSTCCLIIDDKQAHENESGFDAMVHAPSLCDNRLDFAMLSIPYNDRSLVSFHATTDDRASLTRMNRNSEEYYVRSTGNNKSRDSMCIRPLMCEELTLRPQLHIQGSMVGRS